MRMPSIFTDIEEKGYLIFSIKKAHLPNYYPGAFNNFPGVNIHQLNIYDLITIKLFVADGSGNDLPQIIDRYIDCNYSGRYCKIGDRLNFSFEHRGTEFFSWLLGDYATLRLHAKIILSPGYQQGKIQVSVDSDQSTYIQS